MNSFDHIRHYFIRNLRIIFAGLLSLILVDTLQLIIPRIIKTAVDELTVFQARPDALFRYGMAIVGIAVLIAFLRYAWRICLMGLSREIEEGLRNRLFNHLQTLSASWFSRNKTGDLMAHATNDIHQVRMASGMGMVAVTDAAFMGVATVLFMAYINLRLTLLVIIPMPVIVLTTRLVTRRMHKRYLAVQTTFSELTETVRERLAGIRIVKAYNLEDRSYEAVRQISEKNMADNMRLARVMGAFFPVMIFFSNLGPCLVLYFGGRKTVFGDITPGEFVAFISYLGMLTWPMMALGWVINLIQRGRASLNRIGRVLQTSPEIQDDPDSVPLSVFSDALMLHDAEFSYDAGREPVLKGISLRIGRGESLGIIGPPGSGKTTLISLFPRIYDVTKGFVRMDGTDIRRIRLGDLRSSIAFVPQEPFLFSGTIRENITLAEADVDEAALQQAIADASLEKTLANFPKGLETVVGEKGVILSGGQKQRIGLARAFLSQASIFILDDPISQVDAETGAKIIDTIRSLSARSRAYRKTVIVVSHRMSAVRFADQIISLEAGRIAESGTHQELLASGGYYARTLRLQEAEDGTHVL